MLFNPLQKVLPNSLTILGLLENALSPITLWVNGYFTSNTGAQLTLIPSFFKSVAIFLEFLKTNVFANDKFFSAFLPKKLWI